MLFLAGRRPGVSAKMSSIPTIGDYVLESHEVRPALPFLANNTVWLHIQTRLRSRGEGNGMMTSFEKLLKHSNEVGISFITEEVDLAMQLLNTASTAQDEARQKQLRQEARDVYDTVLRCIPHLQFSESQGRKLEEHLKEVRGQLEESNSPAINADGGPHKHRNRSS
jgi:hypothetical protein